MLIVPGSEEDVPGQITINPRGDEARERAKHEQLETAYTSRAGITGHFKPGNPYVHREYPKMLYKALANPRWKGKQMCMEPEPMAWDFTNDDLYQRARDGAAAFTTSCQRIVNNESEEQLAKAQGWYNSAKEAVAGIPDENLKEFVQAGHREYEDRNMSDAAKSEIRVSELMSDGQHVLEVKRKPVSKADRSAAMKKAWEKRKAAKAQEPAPA